MASIQELIQRAEDLGTRVNGYPEFIPEVLPELLAMLENDQDTEVLEAVINSLGLVCNEEACLAVIPFAQHPDDAIRLAAVRSMSGGVDSEESMAKVARALIPRCQDQNPEIRDWALFGIGSQMDLDSPGIREALRRGLSDENYDASCEAMAGLARLGDPAAFPAILHVLNAESVGRLVVESAAELGDPRLSSSLDKLSTWWNVDVELLKRARDACKQPSARRSLHEAGSDT